MGAPVGHRGRHRGAVRALAHGGALATALAHDTITAEHLLSTALTATTVAPGRLRRRHHP
ncbi:hypothetical protein [Saccharothrix sp. ALI-22-I]|uniref:hypothetical protein n=1 Tax=Saccharothrix sp. ALI-22-I TaxID=1933778 RepID=UPI001EE6B34B|nr:hypothetical protein [Saccharothrix sp. ALI-22-I]